MLEVIRSVGKTWVNRSVPSWVLIGPNSTHLGSLLLQTLVSCSTHSVSAFQVSHFVQLHLRMIMSSLSFGVSDCPQPVFKISSFSTLPWNNCFSNMAWSMYWNKQKHILCLVPQIRKCMNGSAHIEVRSWRGAGHMEVQPFFSKTQYCRAHPVYLAQL